MANIFSNVQKANIKKTAFNLSHEVKMSADMGKLLPVLVQEVVPGDDFTIRTEALVKLAPMVAPIMHRVDTFIHYFYVPNRILWNQWQDFITGNLATTCPKFTLTGGSFDKNTLADYMGIPYCPEVTTGGYDVNQLPWRAYWQIWNDYYRDENLQTAVDITALNTNHINNPAWRAWQKDYFTSALPWTQKGDPVEIPINGPVSFNRVTSTGGVTQFPASATGVLAQLESGEGRLKVSGDPAGTNIGIDETSFEVNDLRLAVRLQKWLERNARAGSRYVEHLLAHWGVYSKDASLQRAEYIGGGVTPIMISEVLQTSQTSDTSPQGNPAGHGRAMGNQNFAKKFVEEHGFIMGILSIVPKPAYFQGLNRMFSRSTVTDFYFPEFANLGEQAILNKEIKFVDPGSGEYNFENEETFGYQSRFAEYKYSQDRVCGDFKDSLKMFHLGREFGNIPGLNETFISMAAEAGDLEARVFSAGRDAHPFWVQLYHNIVAKRPMPYYGTPIL